MKRVMYSCRSKDCFWLIITIIITTTTTTIIIITTTTRAMSILRYGAGILKRNKDELQEIDRKTRKFMTMNKELHTK